HVARVLDVGTLESGAPYMVMELLDGQDLGQVLDDHGPLAVGEVADWILQACEAIAEAHAAGIVHRDLKPENLFLARTVGGISQIKVLDFGVSKSIHAVSGGLAGLTRTRAMLGSPLYMSPEQMRSSREVDARADVWALGVVIFELLTTKWPFEAEAMPELCLKVVSDPPQSLAALRPDVPKAMCDVVARCLEKDPARRFANAAELASALEPLAPPASRILAERARLAMSSGAGERMPLRAPSARSASPVSAVAAVAVAATLPSGGTTPLPAGTPSSWGDGSKTESSPPPVPAARRRRWITLAAIIAGALSAGTLVALRAPEVHPMRAIPPVQATQTTDRRAVAEPSAAVTTPSAPSAIALAPASAEQSAAPAPAPSSNTASA
ncbi:MAG: protein kinase domain-containing protein, partial [Polyangiaceae bacterium]